MKQAQRPVCVHCGNRYGSRWTEEEVVEWPVETQMPPYTGNQVVTKQSIYTRSTGFSISRRTAENNGALQIGDTLGHVNVVRRTLWDGETWIAPCQPFCTLRCALDYARKSYNQRQLRRVG